MYGLRCRYHCGAEKTAADSQCHGSLRLPPSHSKTLARPLYGSDVPAWSLQNELGFTPQHLLQTKTLLALASPSSNAGADMKELIALEMSKQVNQLFIAIQFPEIFRYSLALAETILSSRNAMSVFEAKGLHRELSGMFCYSTFEVLGDKV
ncbi:hypothetical protein PIB30_010839 [Stylosanthes scabra]|uniref:Uncharacterized protein n=1 Tax=Stylosanthes scabra TaxID=79078 RepID=A0ABU6R4J9_9FABA|nr:hypothetical protein [Stylosanthes scabra]